MDPAVSFFQDIIGVARRRLVSNAQAIAEDMFVMSGGNDKFPDGIQQTIRFLRIVLWYETALTPRIAQARHGVRHRLADDGG